jgi:hypothetical protein
VSKFKFYKFTMDAFFPNLEGSEIAAIPLSQKDDITRICDIILLDQHVSPGEVTYTPESVADMLERVAASNAYGNKNLVPSGIWHFHPGYYDPDKSPSPSPTDMRDFKKWAEYLMNLQDFFSHKKMTHDYSHIPDASVASLDAALHEKDAAIASSSEFEVYGKVRHGYAFFSIFGVGSDIPWIGLGHHKQDCFDKKDNFELIAKKQGLGLEVWDDPLFPDAFVTGSVFEPYRQDIARYIHPAVPPKFSRGQDIIDAVFSIVSDSAKAKKVSEELPMTAREFISLVGQYLKFAGPDEKESLTAALRHVHEAFSPVYSGNSDYESQFNAAQSLLRQMSPGYDAAMRAKESAGNGKPNGNGANGAK